MYFDLIGRWLNTFLRTKEDLNVVQNKSYDVRKTENDEEKFKSTRNYLEDTDVSDCESFYSAISNAESHSLPIDLSTTPKRTHNLNNSISETTNFYFPSQKSAKNKECKCRRSTDATHKEHNNHQKKCSRKTLSKSILKNLNELRNNIPKEDKLTILMSLNEFLNEFTDKGKHDCMRKEILYFGLSTALPSLLEMNDEEIDKQIEAFFKNTDTTDSLSADPIETFCTAYLNSKNSNCKSLFIQFLDCISKIKVDANGFRRALNALHPVDVKNLKIQNETENAMELGDQTKLFEPPNKPEIFVKKRTKLSNDCGKLSTIEIVPVLRVNRRPRSFSRASNRRSNQSDLNSISSSTDFNSQRSLKHTQNDKSLPSSSCNVIEVKTQQRSLGAFSETSQCLSSPSVSSPLPPPPPPLPFSVSTKSVSDRFIIRGASVQKKKRPTNSIIWEVVKRDNFSSENTIWSSRLNELKEEINQCEMNKLEEVFERNMQKNVKEVKKMKSTEALGLSKKRALNLGIVLARFRHDNIENLIEKIESDDRNCIPSDYLLSLYKHFPTDDEIAYFAKIASPDGLCGAELFCFLIAHRPNVRLKLELKLLEESAIIDLKRQQEFANLTLTIAEKLRKSKLLKEILQRTLCYGNFLNQSSQIADSFGFMLTSLFNTLMARGNREHHDIRLVDILAEFGGFNMEEIIELKDSLKLARKCSVEDMENNEIAIRISIENVLKNFKDYKMNAENLLPERYAFIQESIINCDILLETLKMIRKKEEDLRKYYCAPKMPLQEIFDTFLKSLTALQNSINV